MKNVLIFLLGICSPTFCQNYGNFPKIPKEQLLRDVEILYQGLDKFHTGMYWYTPKDSVDQLFEQAKMQLDRDMNVLEFHKLIAPLVGLSREDHTDIYLPDAVTETINRQATFLPLITVFLGEKLYCVKNASGQVLSIEGKEIESINGKTPKVLVQELGSLFASDGYIQAVKYSDLEGFSFARYFYYYHGNVSGFEVKLKGQEASINLKPLKIEEIRSNLEKRKPKTAPIEENTPALELKFLPHSTAYLGIHSFANDDIESDSVKSLSSFLKRTFQKITEQNIKTLIIDISQNGGGNEGNEGLVYSYLGENYQKYQKVRAKTQKAILDNGKDEPIKLTTFGWGERMLHNKKMKSGSYERKKSAGYGLMAYKKETKYKFKGKLYVIIGPVTYSGGSEFSNMVHSQGLATFVGQETGGGYYGNTSGYSRELTLLHSQIIVDLPALQFVMNVAPEIPFGRGVIPDHKVIPTFEQYVNNENAALEYILKLEKQAQ